MLNQKGRDSELWQHNSVFCNTVWRNGLWKTRKNCDGVQCAL